jgi:hypothetical protein
MKVILHNVNWIKAVFYLGAALLVWVVLWLLSGTLVPLIDVEAVAKYLQDKTPLRFLVPAFQSQVIGLLWQPIAAAITIVTLSKPLGKLYDQIAVILRSPDFLRRVDEKTANQIVERKFPIFGRDHELQILRAFADDKRSFVWCWMIGRGVQGKTRLAVEACLSLTRGDWDRKWRVCDAGFLGAGQDIDQWKAWQPNRPTFIVVDDAASRPSDVEQMLDGLAQRKDNLREPVRVLVVDRQVPAGLANLETNQLLRRSVFQADKRIVVLDFEGHERERFFGEILKSSLDLDAAASAAWIFEMQMHTRGFTAVETMLPFLRSEPIFHPQLAISIAQDRLSRWKNFDIDDRALILVAVATLVNGLDWNDANTIVEDKPSDLVSQIETVTFQRAADRVPPLGSGTIDLGIALLILHERPLPERREIASLAWRVSPIALLNNIQHCEASELPSELFGYFVSPPPDGATQFPEWALLVCLLLQMGTGPGVDWRTLGERLPEAIQQPEKLALAGLLAGGEFLAHYGDGLTRDGVWPYLEGAKKAPSQWPDNKPMQDASAELLKEGIRLLATLGADEQSDEFAERLKVLTEPDLEEAQREIARPDSIKSSSIRRALRANARRCLQLRAESLSSLVGYSAAKAETQPALTYLEELSRIRDILPWSREIAEAHLAALDSICDSPSLVIEEESLSSIKIERSEVSAALSEESKQWETTMGYRRWTAEYLARRWKRHSEQMSG